MQQPSLTRQLKIQSEILLAERRSNQNLRTRLAMLEEGSAEEALYLQELQRKLHQERERALRVSRVQRDEERREENRKIAELEELLSEKEQELAYLRREKSKFFERQHEEAEELNQRLLKAKEERECQGEALLQRQQEILSLEVEIAALRRELEERVSEEELSALRLQLEGKTADQRRFEEELSLLREHLEELERRMRLKEEELLSERERYLVAEAKQEQLRGEVEKNKNALLEKTQALDIHFHRVSELTLDLKNTKEQAQRSHQQIEELHGELRIAQQHLAKKLKEITDLKTKLDREQIEKSQLSEKMEQLTKRLDQFSKESEERESLFKTESIERDKRLQTAERELGFAAKELAKKNEMIEQLSREVDKLKGYEAQLTQIRSLFGQPAPVVEASKPAPPQPKQEEPVLFSSSTQRIRSTLFEE